MTNIRDIAKKVGVSVSTVSKALNGYTDVKEETKKKGDESCKRTRLLTKYNG
ncbi:LacI family transcriptional regulator [Sporolactobacillus sp. THM7-7]|nr:LacI family transcriptional regulator [Sporolactobacillus sp. THM7-7]